MARRGVRHYAEQLAYRVQAHRCERQGLVGVFPGESHPLAETYVVAELTPRCGSRVPALSAGGVPAARRFGEYDARYLRRW